MILRIERNSKYSCDVPRVGRQMPESVPLALHKEWRSVVITLPEQPTVSGASLFYDPTAVHPLVLPPIIRTFCQTLPTLGGKKIY